MNKIQDSIDEIITQPINILPYLQPGRLVKVKDREKKQDWGWGVVVNFQKKNEKVLKKCLQVFKPKKGTSSNFSR